MFKYLVLIFGLWSHLAFGVGSAFVQNGDSHEGPETLYITAIGSGQEVSPSNTVWSNEVGTESGMVITLPPGTWEVSYYVNIQFEDSAVANGVSVALGTDNATANMRGNCFARMQQTTTGSLRDNINCSNSFITSRSGNWSVWTRTSDAGMTEITARCNASGELSGSEGACYIKAVRLK